MYHFYYFIFILNIFKIIYLVPALRVTIAMEIRNMKMTSRIWRQMYLHQQALTKIISKISGPEGPGREFFMELKGKYRGRAPGCL